MAPKLAAVDTWRSDATMRIGLAVPRPADWSPVAEDRSAEGVRDRTGQDNPLVRARSA